MYPTIKHLHMLLAVVSILFFLVRSAWLFTNNALLTKKPIKILPHIIDTFLLASGVTLMVITSQHPDGLNWLSVKLLLIVAYIAFGIFTFRANKKSSRAIFFVLAITAVSFVLLLARTKILPF